ncbi:hypothetical protein EVAR_24207_1 [Eumeta japonica]|uniref:Uncharacterized protein n=1 Tax=Eumeta variegata TaxID=151549 RepID=A0A4C1W766_EUMVA|nr:hypothetical protein EVAR_24207_1 [Eumeta japonica]
MANLRDGTKHGLSSTNSRTVSNSLSSILSNHYLRIPPSRIVVNAVGRAVITTSSPQVHLHPNAASSGHPIVTFKKNGAGRVVISGAFTLEGQGLVPKHDYWTMSIVTTGVGTPDSHQLRVESLTSEIHNLQ